MVSRPIFNIYEIFIQKDHGSPHIWVGSVDAGSPDDAMILARESFLRRDNAVSIWAVPQGQIYKTDYEDKDFFARETDKSYRATGPLAKANLAKWRKYKRHLLDVEQDFVKD